MPEADYELTFHLMWALGIPMDLLVGDTHYATSTIALEEMRKQLSVRSGDDGRPGRPDG